MMHKLDKFVNEMNHISGIKENMKIDPLKEQEKMLKTGNTSLFELEKNKNSNEGEAQKVVEKYTDDFK